MTKPYGCPVVVSRAVAVTAGLDLSRFAEHKATIRGRDNDLDVFAIDDMAELAKILDL